MAEDFAFDDALLDELLSQSDHVSNHTNTPRDHPSDIEFFMLYEMVTNPDLFPSMCRSNEPHRFLEHIRSWTQHIFSLRQQPASDFESIMFRLPFTIDGYIPRYSTIRPINEYAIIVPNERIEDSPQFNVAMLISDITEAQADCSRDFTFLKLGAKPENSNRAQQQGQLTTEILSYSAPLATIFSQSNGSPDLCNPYTMTMLMDAVQLSLFTIILDLDQISFFHLLVCITVIYHRYLPSHLLYLLFATRKYHSIRYNYPGLFTQIMRFLDKTSIPRNMFSNALIYEFLFDDISQLLYTLLKIPEKCHNIDIYFPKNNDTPNTLRTYIDRCTISHIISTVTNSNEQLNENPLFQQLHSLLHKHIPFPITHTDNCIISLQSAFKLLIHYSYLQDDLYSAIFSPQSDTLTSFTALSNNHTFNPPHSSLYINLTSEEDRQKTNLARFEPPLSNIPQKPISLTLTDKQVAYYEKRLVDHQFCATNECQTTEPPSLNDTLTAQSQLFHQQLKPLSQDDCDINTTFPLPQPPDLFSIIPVSIRSHYRKLIEKTDNSSITHDYSLKKHWIIYLLSLPDVSLVMFLLQFLSNNIIILPSPFTLSFAPKPSRQLNISKYNINTYRFQSDIPITEALSQVMSQYTDSAFHDQVLSFLSPDTSIPTVASISRSHQDLSLSLPPFSFCTSPDTNLSRADQEKMIQNDLTSFANHLSELWTYTLRHHDIYNLFSVIYYITLRYRKVIPFLLYSPSNDPIPTFNTHILRDPHQLESNNLKQIDPYGAWNTVNKNPLLSQIIISLIQASAQYTYVHLKHDFTTLDRISGLANSNYPVYKMYLDTILMSALPLLNKSTIHSLFTEFDTNSPKALHFTTKFDLLGPIIAFTSSKTQTKEINTTPSQQRHLAQTNACSTNDHDDYALKSMWLSQLSQNNGYIHFFDLFSKFNWCPQIDFSSTTVYTSYSFLQIPKYRDPTAFPQEQQSVIFTLNLLSFFHYLDLFTFADRAYLSPFQLQTLQMPTFLQLVHMLSFHQTPLSRPISSLNIDFIYKLLSAEKSQIDNILSSSTKPLPFLDLNSSLSPEQYIPRKLVHNCSAKPLALYYPYRIAQFLHMYMIKLLHDPSIAFVSRGKVHIEQGVINSFYNTILLPIFIQPILQTVLPCLPPSALAYSILPNFTSIQSSIADDPKVNIEIELTLKTTVERTLSLLLEDSDAKAISHVSPHPVLSTQMQLPPTTLNSLLKYSKKPLFHPNTIKYNQYHKTMEDTDCMVTETEFNLIKRLRDNRFHYWWGVLTKFTGEFHWSSISSQPYFKRRELVQSLSRLILLSLPLHPFALLMLITFKRLNHPSSSQISPPGKFTPITTYFSRPGEIPITITGQSDIQETMHRFNHLSSLNSPVHPTYLLQSAPWSAMGYNDLNTHSNNITTGVLSHSLMNDISIDPEMVLTMQDYLFMQCCLICGDYKQWKELHDHFEQYMETIAQPVCIKSFMQGYHVPFEKENGNHNDKLDVRDQINQKTIFTVLLNNKFIPFLKIDWQVLIDLNKPVIRFNFVNALTLLQKFTGTTLSFAFDWFYEIYLKKWHIACSMDSHTHFTAGDTKPHFQGLLTRAVSRHETFHFSLILIYSFLQYTLHMDTAAFNLEKLIKLDGANGDQKSIKNSENNLQLLRNIQDSHTCTYLPLHFSEVMLSLQDYFIADLYTTIRQIAGGVPQTLAQNSWYYQYETKIKKNSFSPFISLQFSHLQRYRQILANYYLNNPANNAENNHFLTTKALLYPLLYALLYQLSSRDPTSLSRAHEYTLYSIISIYTQYVVEYTPQSQHGPSISNDLSPITNNFVLQAVLDILYEYIVSQDSKLSGTMCDLFPTSMARFDEVTTDPLIHSRTLVYKRLAAKQSLLLSQQLGLPICPIIHTPHDYVYVSEHSTQEIHSDVQNRSQFDEILNINVVFAAALTGTI